MFRADLHCHSNFSDGEYSPKELLERAKEAGLSAIVITDHDSIAAYSELGENLPVLLGRGIELSCDHREIPVHILGYDFEFPSKVLSDHCARHQEMRKERLEEIYNNLIKMKMHLPPLDLEEEKKSFGRPHLAELLVEKGYAKDVQHAFKLFLREGCPAYVKGPSFSVEAGIDLIHRAGGKAFLAHPHLQKRKNLLRELIALPIDGIECYYAKIPSHQEQHWVRIAEDKGLLISGGSDFHGMSKPMSPFGSSWVDEERFWKIFSKDRVYV